MKKYVLPWFAAVFLFMVSCRTDFDVNADWEDITVVFGLLDQDETSQYIRINKAFLGDEDAYVMAQESDSLYYDSLNVYLEEYRNGQMSQSIQMVKTINEFIKYEGIFANDVNILYKTDYQLRDDAIYKLVVFIPRYGKTVTGSTSLISGLSFGNNFESSVVRVNLSNQQTIELNSAENARIYDLIIRLHYYETYDGITFTHDSIDWMLPTAYSSSIDGNEKIEIPLIGETFMKFLNGNITEDSEVKRIIRSTRYVSFYPPALFPDDKRAVDVFVSMGGEDLNTFIQVNEPSNGIVQERPAFSNIENGIGLFSCRSTVKVLNKEVTTSTLDSIARSNICKKLNFVDSNGELWWE